MSSDTKMATPPGGSSEVQGPGRRTGAGIRHGDAEADCGAKNIAQQPETLKHNSADSAPTLPSSMKKRLSSDCKIESLGSSCASTMSSASLVRSVSKSKQNGSSDSMIDSVDSSTASTMSTASLVESKTSCQLHQKSLQNCSSLELVSERKVSSTKLKTASGSGSVQKKVQVEPQRPQMNCKNIVPLSTSLMSSVIKRHLSGQQVQPTNNSTFGQLDSQNKSNKTTLEMKKQLKNIPSRHLPQAQATVRPISEILSHKMGKSITLQIAHQIKESPSKSTAASTNSVTSANVADLKSSVTIRLITHIKSSPSKLKVYSPTAKQEIHLHKLKPPPASPIQKISKLKLDSLIQNSSKRQTDSHTQNVSKLQALSQAQKSSAPQKGSQIKSSSRAQTDDQIQRERTTSEIVVKSELTEEMPDEPLFSLQECSEVKFEAGSSRTVNHNNIGRVITACITSVKSELADVCHVQSSNTVVDRSEPSSKQSHTQASSLKANPHKQSNQEKDASAGEDCLQMFVDDSGDTFSGFDATDNYGLSEFEDLKKQVLVLNVEQLYNYLPMLTPFLVQLKENVKDPVYLIQNHVHIENILKAMKRESRNYQQTETNSSSCVEDSTKTSQNEAGDSELDSDPLIDIILHMQELGDFSNCSVRIYQNPSTGLIEVLNEPRAADESKSNDAVLESNPVKCVAPKKRGWPKGKPRRKYKQNLESTNKNKLGLSNCASVGPEEFSSVRKRKNGSADVNGLREGEPCRKQARRESSDLRHKSNNVNESDGGIDLPEANYDDLSEDDDDRNVYLNSELLKVEQSFLDEGKEEYERMLQDYEYKKKLVEKMKSQLLKELEEFEAFSRTGAAGLHSGVGFSTWRGHEESTNSKKASFLSKTTSNKTTSQILATLQTNGIVPSTQMNSSNPVPDDTDDGIGMEENDEVAFTPHGSETALRNSASVGIGIVSGAVERSSGTLVRGTHTAAGKSHAPPPPPAPPAGGVSLAVTGNCNSAPDSSAIEEKSATSSEVGGGGAEANMEDASYSGDDNDITVLRQVALRKNRRRKRKRWLTLEADRGDDFKPPRYSIEDVYGTEGSSSNCTILQRELIIPASQKYSPPMPCFVTQFQETIFYCCVKCLYQTNNRYRFRTHYYVHSYTAYKCSYCPFVNNHQAKLAEHEVRHFMAKQSEITCNLCNFTCYDKKGLSRHKLLHKDGESLMKFCEECEFSSMFFAEVREHGILKHGIAQLKTRLECVVCTVCFKTMKCFCKHMNEHIVNGRYACPRCDYTDKDLCALQEHMRFKHNKDSIKCHMCDYKTLYASNLAKHIQSHSMAVSFSCTTCKFEAPTKQLLHKHLMSHYENCLACTKCDHVSGSFNEALNHLAVHLGDKQAPIVCCIDCSYNTADYWEMRKHLLIEHNYRNKALMRLLISMVNKELD